MSKQEVYRDLNSLKGILDRTKARRVLLVTGKNSYRNSGAEKILSKIIENIDIFQDYETNPKIEDLKKGMKFMFDKNYDMIIGLGGGSTIDIAKMLSFFNKQDFSIDQYLKGQITKINESTPLIAIPTTAGSGSEATKFAVLYINGIKHSIESDFILPKYVILDYKLTLSMPKSVAVSSGLDALCQGIESYWSNKSTEHSKLFAKNAIVMCINNIEDAIIKQNEDSIKRMLEASNYAGNAINITRTTAPHALSYHLTSQYNIQHGIAVAMLMTKFLEINNNVNLNNVNDNRGVGYVKRTMKEIFGFLKAKNCKDAKANFIGLLKNLGVELEIDKLTTFHDLLKYVNIDRLQNNPVLIK